MSKFLKLFNSHLEYQLYAESNDFVSPNVSRCINLDEVHYTPEPYYGFCKLTLDTGEIIEIEGSGTISRTHLSLYSSKIVEIQLGLLCTDIARSATNDCSKLTSVIIGKNVRSVYGSSLHNYTYSIKSIIVEKGNSKYDSRNNCNAVIETATNKLIRGCNNTIIPDGVTDIGNSAFSDSSFTSINIPNSVTSIGNYAFEGCSSLTSITSLATTAPSISNTAFWNIKTGGTLYVPAGATGYDVWMGTGDYYLGKYNWTKIEQ